MAEQTATALLLLSPVAARHDLKAWRLRTGIAIAAAGIVYALAVAGLVRMPGNDLDPEGSRRRDMARKRML